ncbi:MAG TPA: adenosylhomocysteinase [Solirubrobacteraceae bacterium]|jgi:adenosylhomocysteinase
MAAADSGQARIEWADAQMPVLAQVRERLARERPLQGIRIAACLHVTAETANLMRALLAGGAQVGLCAANPLSTQDDVAVALSERHGANVRSRHGESAQDYAAHVAAMVQSEPQITIDDGADLIGAIHDTRPEWAAQMLGGTEETTAGLLRVRGLESQGKLACPVLAVNESRTERALNDRFGTGQSTVDGILRATNLLLAGRTVVVLGYGPTGRGVALRSHGAGASVIVCEVDPLRALEARMEGYEVMPALAACEHGDVFVTVTGGRDVLRAEHMRVMKDGAVLANAGHFDVEISLADLDELAEGRRREVLPLVEQFTLPSGNRVNLLAQGRVVNLAAGQGHPAAVMDISFAAQALCVEYLVAGAGELERRVLAVPAQIDSEVARLKLDSLGVQIDELTDAQREYRSAWGFAREPHGGGA